MGLGNDRSALKSRLGIELKHVLDLGEALRGRGEGRIGHRGTVGAKVAVAHFFGQRLQKSKRIGTSNWDSRRLNERLGRRLFNGPAPVKHQHLIGDRLNHRQR